jgi:peptidyl-prolyl cis-trans isomerase A (cyclophilin A)
MFHKAHLFLLCILFSCSQATFKNPHVVIRTQFGDVEAELYAEQAPKSVSAFLAYVDSGFYKGASFYRVLRDDNQPSNALKAELIQGGMWRTNRKKAETIPGIPHETTQQTGILHKDGVLSLARLAPGSANTEFFICIGSQPGFDYGGENNPDGQGYAAFGKVVKGMDIVKKIYNARENEQYFTPPVHILNIVKL